MLPDDAIDSLACRAEVRSFQRGERIVEHGSDALRFFVVLEGTVQLLLPHPDGRSTVDGCERVLGLLVQGMSFGQAAAVLEAPYPVSARANQSCRLLSIPSDDLAAMIAAHPQFALRVLEETSRRLHEVVGDVWRYTQDSAARRLARYLLVNAIGRTPDEDTVRWTGRKSEVASLLSITPETLSRELGRLKASGIVSERDGTLTIHDPGRLRTIATDAPVRD